MFRFVRSLVTGDPLTVNVEFSQPAGVEYLTRTALTVTIPAGSTALTVTNPRYGPRR